MANKVTVWTFDYCTSSVGVWSKAFFLTERAAKRARAKQIKALGVPESEMDLIGNYGDVTPVISFEVDTSPKGVIRALYEAQDE